MAWTSCAYVSDCDEYEMSVIYWPAMTRLQQIVTAICADRPFRPAIQQQQQHRDANS